MRKKKQKEAKERGEGQKQKNREGKGTKIPKMLRFWVKTAMRQMVPISRILREQRILPTGFFPGGINFMSGNTFPCKNLLF